MPGCHTGTDEKGEPSGRMFGEACLPDGMLVESNPDAVEPRSCVRLRKGCQSTFSFILGKNVL